MCHGSHFRFDGRVLHRTPTASCHEMTMCDHKLEVELAQLCCSQGLCSTKGKQHFTAQTTASLRKIL
eukprot:m.159928 g.159928  ORF g.159928 m.159928 type:complete len:67 (+) comp23768_c0_seq1:882-1082(+)